MIAAIYAAWDYLRVSQIYRPQAQRYLAYRDSTFESVRDTLLFRRQVDFAELSLTPLTLTNALKLSALSHQLLHFSPEPRVIEKVIESALLLKLEDEARFHEKRYLAAFPEDYARWCKKVASEQLVNVPKIACNSTLGGKTS